MTGNELRLRNARFEECDEIARLLREAYQQYAASIPEPAWETYLENIMDVRSRFARSQIIVAEIDKRLLGTVTLYLDSRHAETEWRKGWAGIRLLAVHPAYRGRGIGRALMDECIRHCRENNITTIGLHTTELMALARRMYERMGFRRIPKFDFHPAPDRLVMAYRLDMKKKN